MLNKKAVFDVGEIIQLSLIVLLLALSFLFLFSSSNVDIWRRSPEGKCLKDIAIKFCSERDMEFNKIYSPLYRSIWKSEDFSCNDYGLTNIYAFTRSEEEKCMRALTK